MYIFLGAGRREKKKKKGGGEPLEFSMFETPLPLAATHLLGDVVGSISSLISL
jgi:hypothetical protein